MENLIELRKKLQHLAEQLEQKNNLSNDAFMSEEEYIENNIHTEKPQKRSVSNSERVEIDYLSKKDQLDRLKTGSIIKYISGLIILIGEGLLAFIIWLLPVISNIIGGKFSFEQIFLSAIPLLLTLPFFLIGLSLYKNGKKAKKQIKNYFSSLENSRARAKQIDQKNEIYNQNEYPQLLAVYNTEVERLKPLYKKMRNEAQAKLDDLNAQMAKEEVILAEKYHPYINDIIEIIDDGRASSLAEAINILISDQNAQRLLDEQMRQNEIQAQATEIQRQEAEAQRKEMERHNRQMEATAKENLQMQQAKIDYSKCHNCANERYCYKKICTGYRPKK